MTWQLVGHFWTFATQVRVFRAQHWKVFPQTDLSCLAGGAISIRHHISSLCEFNLPKKLSQGQYDLAVRRSVCLLVTTHFWHLSACSRRGIEKLSPQTGLSWVVESWKIRSSGAFHKEWDRISRDDLRFPNVLLSLRPTLSEASCIPITPQVHFSQPGQQARPSCRCIGGPARWKKSLFWIDTWEQARKT